MSRKHISIILDKYLRIGDRVVMAMDPESRAWGGRGVADGTKGTVIGYARYEQYVPRVRGYGQRPGRYLRNGAGVVAWDTGEHDTPGAHNLRWDEDHYIKNKKRSADCAWNSAFDELHFVGELPELPFFEDDLVRDSTGRVTLGKGDVLRISRIKYEHLGEKRDDGTPMPLYDVEAVEGNHGYTWLPSANLVLRERGRVWKWFNGKRHEIQWKDVFDEASFHGKLGLQEEVRNPATGVFLWDAQHIVDGLIRGVIDAPKVVREFFNAHSSFYCYRLHDRDLGERLRTEFLRAYAEPGYVIRKSQPLL